MAGRQYPAPPMRRIRVFAFDPQASMTSDSAAINVATIKLPWEQSWEEPLSPGPVNDYLEVIDIDPVSGQLYEPVDLNHPFLLAQDGLAPSEGDPLFHQQMVFAVSMKTIRIFERALGRRVLWAPRLLPKKEQTEDEKYKPVDKLRVHPHALREPNAYYSREKKALLFGYFQTSTQHTGARWVFTALSHDIVVHEVTHAILDGLHRRFAEPTSADSLAFHEAFADIVALLSHFTIEEAVKTQIAKQGGRLDNRSILSGLARQFGAATGRDGALREAIDDMDDRSPVTLTDELVEPHERGAVLVAAVFDAFLSIYEKRTADLLRIAGVRPDPGLKTLQAGLQDLHPDLVSRLTREAAKAADHIMRMCIRSLDYLPPVDVRFGDFLRAIVTADHDLVPDDPMGYRMAVIDGFRRRGIFSEECLSLAVDSLLWEAPPHELTLKDLDIRDLDLQPKFERSEVIKAASENAKHVHSWLRQVDDDEEVDRRWQETCGVVFRHALIPEQDRETIHSHPGNEDGDFPPVEVHSVRTTRRTGPDGQDLRQLIIEIAQQRRGFLSSESQRVQDADPLNPKEPDFIFRGGSTLIFDLREGHLRYAIRKPIADDVRLERQRAFLTETRFGASAQTYAANAAGKKFDDEPFAFVHRGC